MLTSRPRFTLAAVMAAVALIALGLVWRPLFFLMGLSVPAAFAVAGYGVPRAIDGLLAAAPVAIWAAFLAVVVPLSRDWHGCSGWGFVCGFYLYSVWAMLACEAVALWRCWRGATPMLRAAVVMNWSWLYFWVILQYGNSAVELLFGRWTPG